MCSTVCGDFVINRSRMAWISEINCLWSKYVGRLWISNHVYFFVGCLWGPSTCHRQRSSRGLPCRISVSVVSNGNLWIPEAEFAVFSRKRLLWCKKERKKIITKVTTVTEFENNRDYEGQTWRNLSITCTSSFNHVCVCLKNEIEFCRPRSKHAHDTNSLL